MNAVLKKAIPCAVAAIAIYAAPRFESLVLIASPYVAGPWVEGSYEINLPVTADLITALKSEYQGSFETAQPQ